MALPRIPGSWLRPLLTWWVVLALSLAVMGFVAPKRYTAETSIILKRTRTPWPTFRTGKLPTSETDEESLDALINEQSASGAAGVNLWNEISLVFLLDQLAFDAYDFRPFLSAKSTTLAAIERAGLSERFGVGTFPPDLLAMSAAEDLSITWVEGDALLTIGYTHEDPAVAEAMTRAYLELLDQWINTLLDEKDAEAMTGLSGRRAALETEVSEADAALASYEREQALAAPKAFLAETYTYLLGLEERAARQTALAEAARAHVSELEGRQAARGDADVRPVAAGDSSTSASSDVLRDPALVLVRDALVEELLSEEQDRLLYTDAHPRMAAHTQRIADLTAQLAAVLGQSAGSEVQHYRLEAITADARAAAYRQAQGKVREALDAFPAHEQEIIERYRERRLKGALLVRMRELEDMAVSLLEKREAIFRVVDAPHTASRPTEPSLGKLGALLYLLGTMGACGWLSLRDRLARG